MITRTASYITALLFHGDLCRRHPHKGSRTAARDFDKGCIKIWAACPYPTALLACEIDTIFSGNNHGPYASSSRARTCPWRGGRDFVLHRLRSRRGAEHRIHRRRGRLWHFRQFRLPAGRCRPQSGRRAGPVRRLGRVAACPPAAERAFHLWAAQQLNSGGPLQRGDPADHRGNHRRRIDHGGSMRQSRSRD